MGGLPINRSAVNFAFINSTGLPHQGYFSATSKPELNTFSTTADTYQQDVYTSYNGEEDIVLSGDEYYAATAYDSYDFYTDGVESEEILSSFANQDAWTGTKSSLILAETAAPSNSKVMGGQHQNQNGGGIKNKSPPILRFIAKILKMFFPEIDLAPEVDTPHPLTLPPEISRVVSPYRPELEELLSIVRRFDPVTYHHSLKSAELAYLLLQKDLLEGKREAFVIAALLHDVGKIAIPPDILKKPGELTEAERLFIKKHPRESFEIVCELIIEMIGRVDPQKAAELQKGLEVASGQKDFRPVFRAIGELGEKADRRLIESLLILEDAVKILVTHHEHEEGKNGYPRGGVDRRQQLLEYIERRRGERREANPIITRLGRTLSITDQFEAHTSPERAFYRSPLPSQEAAEKLKGKFHQPEDGAIIDALSGE